ncbi:MAG TPA: lipocalin-like domain-containing protein [Steroidobacteraceae bacterium]|nr:lipocalin-like domain-containing protein [Steroidobacteraceae bacterium]
MPRALLLLCCAGLLIGCQRTAVTAAGSELAAAAPLDVLRAGAGTVGFAQALAPREFVFPADHGAHRDFRHEWWYVTGNLRGADGARYGIELTIFRVALAPPGATAPVSAVPTSRWHTNQLYAAHFAVTDVARGAFDSSERYGREALGLAGAQTNPLRVWVGGWSLAAADPQREWTLNAADEHVELALRLQPLVAPVANGERGLSVKSSESGAASYYYCIPRLAVSGELARDGASIEVSGEAWLDREWGSGGLGRAQSGWDWYALQFRDGSALMFYALRGQAAERDAHSAGTWVGADGSSRRLASADVDIDVLRHWTSPRGGVYPAAWRIRVASLALDIEVTPVLADQELAASPRYWEGAVDVRGARGGASTAGEGYVELVGYAR